ncbi:hypothetical protein ACHAXT_004490 [Thalassiosira profunda]
MAPGPGPGGKSAIDGSSRLDVDRLQREVLADVATYRQYKAEDGMKKRAIHTSKDYNEFRNFVSVSQLKPTSGRDVSSLFSGASGTVATGGYARSQKTQGGKGSIGSFEDVIQRRKDTSSQSNAVAKLDGDLQSLSLDKSKSTTLANRAGAKTSQSSRAAHDFLVEWKRHCKTANDTLAFLARVDDALEGSFESKLILQPELICREYFATDLDSDVSEGIIEALHLLVSTKEDGACREDAANDFTLQNSGGDGVTTFPELDELWKSEANVLSFVDGWLRALPVCGRFELSLSFLSSDQRQTLRDICSFLRSKDDKAKSCDYLCRYDSLLK